MVATRAHVLTYLNLAALKGIVGLTSGIQCRVKDKNGETPFDLVAPSDTEVLKLMRKARAQASMAREDVASGAYLSVPYVNCGLM